MTRRPARNEVDAALAAVEADDLRELVRDLMLTLDERSHRRMVNSLMSRAARGASGCAPAPLSERDVAEVTAFVNAAKRVGFADPSDVDDCLGRGSAAFLRKHYAAAHRIFGMLLPPIIEAEIDLGQHEMVDEVLGLDAGECAAQYVVSAYMLATPGRRATAVRRAIDEVEGVGYFTEPIRTMERVAVEALPGLDDFLPRWRALVAKDAGRGRRSDWDTDADRWLREVVWRMDGAEGLAELARSTRRADDLQAWCRGLVQAGNWSAALPAFEEAAALVADRTHARGDFFDGAALAAQELGRKDLSAWFEQAWRAAPTMVRLRRWLGSARGKRAIRKRAAEALQDCPQHTHRQRAFLHGLLGDFESAAKLLGAAPGLGWSEGEHPGHLLFPLFQSVLSGKGDASSAGGGRLPDPELDSEDLEDWEPLTEGRDKPRLGAPEADEILRRAGVKAIAGAGARRFVLTAMRESAEKRLAGVTEFKRRRHYGHAASLVAACLACDPSPEARAWAAAIRAQYRRFPALRAEFDLHLRSP